VNETRVLTASDVRRLLDLDACISAVESAFRLHAAGRSLSPGVLAVRAPEGGFHVKAAGLVLSRTYFAAKTNANFTSNPARHGLPTIQGVVVLFDGDDGSPLAVLDSIEITLARTAAATAVAARYLALPDARVATVCGCGAQGRAQLRALCRVLPLERVHAFDRDRGRSEAFARELSSELAIDVRAVADPGASISASAVVVTATPSREPFVLREQVAPGAFIAAVGADSPEKQELDPRILAESAVVVDVLEQCAAIGELHHGLRSGLVTREDVRAELAEVVSGTKPGRSSEDEIVVFDSTGTAIEDVAAAALVYEKAMTSGAGMTVSFGA
jgi:alanine dehydrogenase